MKRAQVTRGQTISFRIPSDAPDHLVKGLQRLKETERRNFSSKIAEFVLEGVSQSNALEREMINIPLPQKLTQAEKDWLKHEHSEALIGSILYQLISDPVRASALLASLNSPSISTGAERHLEAVAPFGGSGVDEVAVHREEPVLEPEEDIQPPLVYDLSDMEVLDDLEGLSLDNTNLEASNKEVDDIAGEIDPDDILGDFLAAMNK
jgi:hypothetical protein